MQKKFKIVSLLLVTIISLGMIFPAALFAAESNDPVDRIYGAERYQTALNVAKFGWSAGSETVILAPGSNANLVDALTAAPLAKSENAPILLTKPSELDSSVQEYLELKTETVYVVSGAISKEVIKDLEAMDIEVKNLGGKDRFITATNIAKEIKNVTGVFVTTAHNNADALSIASIAASKGMPILLSDAAKLPEVETAYLEEIKANLTKSYVIGGETLLSDTVKDAIPGEADRIFGVNRFETNLKVLEAFYADVTNYEKVYMANGTNNHLVDALVASTLAASSNSPIVLVNKDLDAAMKSHVEGKLSNSSRIIALGGESVVSSTVQTANIVRAQDFGVMTFGGVNGYSVGFKLMGGKDFIASNVAAVEVSLYDQGNHVLAKNISTNKLFTFDGPEFSSPFNINGNYPGDAYWTYGEWSGTVHSVPAKAVISVTLFNGQTFVVENSKLTGDTQTLLTEDEKHVKTGDFAVMQLSGVNGYNVGFSLIDGKDASDLSSIEVSVYDKDGKLLAKNTAASKLLRLTATELSSPFNIDGSFQADGYWNYGTWNGTTKDIPAKAVIKVTYEGNGKTYTVENKNLSGDPSKLGPAQITSDLATQATLNSDIAFGVKTIANVNTSEVVRVKATLTEGKAEDFQLMYQQGDAFYALPFTDGVTWYGPTSGFPLSDLTSNFKINFKTAGTYGYKLDVVRVSDSKVLATTTNIVEVK